MTEAPLSRHLPRFARRLPLGFLEVTPTPPVEVTPGEPSVTMTEQAFRFEIEREGAAVREKVDVEYAAAMSALRVESEVALKAAVSTERARLLSDCGGEVARHVEAAFASLHETLASEIAAALRPLLVKAVVQRTTAAVLEATIAALADPHNPSLTVRGPAERLAAIEASFGSRAGIGYIVEDTNEVVVTSSGARIETRLAAALASLAELEEASS